MASNQSVTVKNKGLGTNPNYLSAVPAGSHRVAKNVVIDRDEIVEPRRGLAQYGDIFGVGSSDVALQMFEYKDRILLNHSDKLIYDSDGEGTWATFTGGSSLISSPVANARIRAIEANGNFYFTSSKGVKKISAASGATLSAASIEDSGGVSALDIAGTTDFTQTGFLTFQHQVAYRVVWGIRDINDNLILGSPSNRTVVQNLSASQSCVANLTINKPSEIGSNTSYFYQVYRTAIFDLNTTPSEDYYLVIEDFYDGSSNPITVTDITPDTIRAGGTPLYTSVNAGDGAESANEKPPFANDICAYKGYTFYGNTKTFQNLDLSILSVDDLVSNTSQIQVLDGTTTETYRFRGTRETYSLNFNVSGAATGASYLTGGTNPGGYFTLESATPIVSPSQARGYYFWYASAVSGAEVDPLVSGKIGIQVVIAGGDTPAQVATKTYTAILAGCTDFNMAAPGASTLSIKCSNNGFVVNAPTTTLSGVVFSISRDSAGTGEDSTLSPPRVFLPYVPSAVSGADGTNGPSISQQLEQAALSLVRVINNHSAIISAFYLSGPDEIPGQIKLKNKDISDPAFYLRADTTTTGEEFNPTIPTSGQTVISTNETRPNRLYYSKFQQPEAVPLGNYIDVGPKDRAIKRIIALRESLFILKEDGVYRISGESAPFTLTPFDLSVNLIATDTAVALNNQIHALTNQGVVAITDGGINVISRPIENLLLNLTRPGYDYAEASFAVAYESDRSYLLWIVSETTDTVATQCFRYNTFTQTWTQWETTHTCGLVKFSDNKLYVGAGDINFIEQERKNLDKTDYADREYAVQIAAGGVTDNTVFLSSVANADPGDALEQTQYMTIYQFNTILRMLDREVNTDQDYFSTQEFEIGEEPKTKITALATKLDADAGITANDFVASTTSYSKTITSTSHTLTQTVLTFASNNPGIETGRWVTISGSNTTPSIDGTYQVQGFTATTITINAVITVDGNAGTVSTLDSDFRDMQGCFNIIVGILNADSGLTFSNYPTSSGSITFPTTIEIVTTNGNSVNVYSIMPLMQGIATIYKAIETELEYNPQAFGDPSVLKQVRESTFMFENTNFSKITLGFASDLSPGFYEIETNGVGSGDYGEFSYGADVPYGGIGAAFPLRMYLPTGKQRCRFSRVRFKHKIAHELYSFYGISLTFRPYSTRGYR